MSKLTKRFASMVLCVVMMFGTVAVGGEGFIAFLESFTLKASAKSYVCLADLECVDEGHYTGNEGDARVYKLDASEFLGVAPRGYNNATTRNGNIGVNGTSYSNGFEVWIARWNSGDRISWAYRTFKLSGEYKVLSGKSGLINSYNTSDFDDTVFFYNGDTLLYAFNLTPLNYEQSFNVNVEGVDELKVLIQDNTEKAGGTSFALYDLFFDVYTESYKQGDIIEFGSYPQRKVSDSSLIEQLNSQSITWNSYEYVSGDGMIAWGSAVASDYMRFCDVSYNGEKYRGVIFDTYRPTDILCKSLTVPQYYNEKYLQKENGYEHSNVYWFEYEPIRWRVLDSLTGFVVSENILDAQPYVNNIYRDYSDNSGYSDSDYTKHASNYEYSYIRTWLNSDKRNCFWGTAFSFDEKEAVRTTYLNNDSYGTILGDSGYEELDSVTNDKIFLLSYLELKNEEYGFDPDEGTKDENRVACGTDYAKAQGLSAYNKQYTSIYDPNGVSSYYLRTSAKDDDWVLSGNINCGAIDRTGVASTGNGVRPAMCLDLSQLDSNHQTDYSVFNENKYSADVLLGKRGTDVSSAYQTLNDIYGYQSTSSLIYDDLNGNKTFQAAVAGWQGMKCVFDPTTGLNDLVLEKDDLYEGLIFDLIKNVTIDNNQYIASILNDSQQATMENIGSVKKEVTKYYNITKNINNTLKYTDQSFAVAKQTYKTTGNVPNNLSVYLESDEFKSVTKLDQKWYSKVFKYAGMLLDVASDVNDFYKRLNLYIMASEMSEEMVAFLQKMYTQTDDASFRIALTNVIAAFQNADYAAVICTLDLGTDIVLDVMSPLIDEVISMTPLGPFYAAWKLSYQASTAFCNMMFNTGGTIDKYYLCGATKEFVNCTKSTINSLASKYLSTNEEADAGAYLYAVKTYKWAFYSDMESACEFVKAGSEEGLINLAKKAGRFITEKVTGQHVDSPYESMVKSKESIMQSLSMLFDSILTDWLYNDNLLKEDHPDIYVVYIKNELTTDLYNPHVSSVTLLTNAQTEVIWDNLCYYVDGHGYYRVKPANHLLNGFEATENINGSKTTKRVVYSFDGMSAYFYNSSLFTTFPKIYSVRGYTDTYYTGSEEYTNTITQNVESPLDFDIQFYNGFIGIVDYANSNLADITTYEIYRKTNNSSYTKIKTLDRSTGILDLFLSFTLGKSAGLTMYKDNNTTTSTTYTYKVVKKLAFTNGKSLSKESKEIIWKYGEDKQVLDLRIKKSNSTQKTSAKMISSNGSGNQSQANSVGIQLSWDKLNNAVGYEIYRKCSYGTVYRLIDSVESSVTSYFDTNIENGIDYEYKVYPVYKDNNGNSVYSDDCYYEGEFSDSESPSGKCGDNLTWSFNENNGVLTVSGTGEMYDYNYSFYDNNIYTTSASWKPYFQSIKSVIIKSGVTSIGRYAFYGCSNLKSIDIPDSVISIGSYAFNNCINLTSITIPKKVTTINAYTFERCKNLSSVTMHDGITSIKSGAFSDCTSLTHIDIPRGVIFIGVVAFLRCKKMTAISVDKSNPSFSSDEYGVLYNKDKTELIQYPIGNARTSFSIPNSVLTISCDAFFGSTALANVTIPISVKTIESHSFFGSGLTNVFYGGSEADKNTISFSDDNEELLNASWHYNQGPSYFVLNYNANGGKGAPANQTGNGTITLSTTKPTRDDYTFKGWATSARATAAQYSAGASYNLTANTTLYAVWQKSETPPTQPKVKSVSLGDVTLNYKAKTTLKPQITADDGAKYTVSYSSSNPNVAKVDANGTVTGAKKGTATITCTVTDSYGNTVTDTCKVTVNYTWWQWIIIILLFGWIWY